MMNTRNKAFDRLGREHWLLSAAIVAFALSATPTLADEAPDGAEGIVVTATRPTTTGSKSDTPPVEVPQSLSVVGRALMDAQAIQTVSQAIAYQAGVFNGSTAANGRYDRISLRGFDVTNSGVLVDGLRATTAQSYTKVEPYGLERVEVLRGPASVLYGQNSPGGLVNMISKRPGDTLFLEMVVQGGSFDRIEGRFDANMPLGDTLAVRVTGLVRDADTQIKVVPDDKLFLAPALSWRPASDTLVTLLTSITHEKYGPPAFGIPLQGSLLPNANGRIRRNFYSDEPGVDNTRDQYAAGILLEQGLGTGWKLRSALRYTDTDFLTETVSARGAPANGRLLGRSFYRFRINGEAVASDSQLQGEWRLGGVGMKTMAGLDYRHTREDYWLRAGAAQSIDVFEPVYGTAYGPATTPFASTLQTSNQVGAYGEQQMRFFDSVILSGGLRHDWSDTATRNRLTATRTSQSDEANTWRLGAVWRAPKGLTPYLSYATSFNPVLGTDFYGEAYKPSKGKQLEAGLRFESAGAHTYMTLSAYRLTQTNVQTTDPDNSLNQIQTGAVRSRGIEAEVVSSPIKGLNLTGSATFADLAVTRTTIASQLGRRPTAQPERMAALWADYTLQTGALAGFGLGAGLRYIGPTYADAINTIRVPGYGVVDAMVRYDAGRWRVSVNATNLFDKYYYVSCSGPGCGEGTARTILASLSYRWGDVR